MAALLDSSAPNRSMVTLKWKLMYLWMVGRSMAPAARTFSGSSVPSSRITWQVRWITLETPDSPTNMWCASSVSMKRVVRASGSKADSARAQSWNLPSRSVK